MNRRLLSLLIAALAIVACGPQVFGSSLSVVSDTPFALPYTEGVDPAVDISAAGNLDWVVINKNQKAGASVIDAPGNAFPSYELLFVYADYGLPAYSLAFSYADGENPPHASATYERADLLIGDASDTVNLGYSSATTLALPAGSGTLSLWWGFPNVMGGDATFTLTMADSTTLTHDAYTVPTFVKTVVNWQSDTAQTVSLELSRPACLWAAAVSVPEPGTLALIGSGLIGLVAYAWRKRT